MTFLIASSLFLCLFIISPWLAITLFAVLAVLYILIVNDIIH